MKRQARSYIIFFICTIAFYVTNCTLAYSECISSFPYSENFEGDNGGWGTGGENSDWEWGEPSKSIIKASFDGTRCWITGGLNKSSYNSNQQAWLRTPCFNFSNIGYPFISFHYFSDTEEGSDGAALEYSTDNGATWLLAGTTDNYTDCLNQNWYNISSVQYIGNRNGWSGRKDWASATLPLPQLAGQENVIFRFLFGTGGSNNDFNGFAVDAFTIGESPSANATFDYRCIGPRSILAEAGGDGCTKYSWDFGDPASGIFNTSNIVNPLHAFSGPGLYKIMLAASRPGAKPDTGYQTVLIHDIETNIVNTPTCSNIYGGSASVSFTTPLTNPTITWNTDPQQTTATATGLAVGSYTVTVMADSACPQTRLVNITNPSAISLTAKMVQPACNVSDGSIAVTATGGIGAYNYQWEPQVGNSDVGDRLKAGLYKITATDASGCKSTISVNLANKKGPSASVLNKQDVICRGGGSGWAYVTVSGGDGPYTYQWIPRGGTDSVAQLLTAGTYAVTVTDKNNCISTPTVVIGEPEETILNIQKTNTSCGFDNGAITVTPTGGTGPYLYSWHSLNLPDKQNFASGLGPGSYLVATIDAKGCVTYSDTMKIEGSIGLTAAVNPTGLLCANDNSGGASVQVSGGTPPYSFTWSNRSSANSIAGLAAGEHWVRVSDGDCSVFLPFVLARPPALSFSLMAKEATCGNANGILEAVAGGGSPPYQYRWPAGVSPSPQATGLVAGTYTVLMTDKNGCADSAKATIKDIYPLSISLGADTGICRSEEIIVLSPGKFDSYRWQDGSTQGRYSASLPGVYSVTVSDGQGCTASSSIKIVEDCGDIYFPSAFTPNGDGKNDRFGMLGNVSFVKNYRLIVYNRWGQAVFQTSDPYEKWDGKTAGTIITGTYVWVAHASTRLQPFAKNSGTVMVIM